MCLILIFLLQFLFHLNCGKQVTLDRSKVPEIVSDAETANNKVAKAMNDKIASVLIKKQFFQDIFSEHLTPQKIQFGHVCENPTEWEQRFEQRDYEENRHRGKVKWGDKNGGYGESYWDLVQIIQSRYNRKIVIDKSLENREYVMKMEGRRSTFVKNEAKYSKNPSSPTSHSENIIIGNGLTDRIQTGTMDQERLTNYDNCWIEKLRRLDEEHSKRNNLDLNEIEKLSQSLMNYAKVSRDKICAFDSKKLMDCFQQNKGQTLICNNEVQNFVNCIDKLLYETTRAEYAGPRAGKKLSYAERFQQGVRP